VTRMLDDAARLHAMDPEGMLSALATFPDRLRHATALCEGVRWPHVNALHVVVAGMGGSGISGELLRDWARDRMDVPVGVVNDYHLPAYCGTRTVVFVESYSGNTEETLSCFEEALVRGCPTIVVASGGQLARRAEREGVPFVHIPGDLPKPRSATPYLLVPLLVGMEQLGLAYSGDELREAHAVCSEMLPLLAPESPTDRNVAKQLAHTLLGTVPAVYGQGVLRGVARRWRTQLNENSKMLARDDFFPECNHNDTPAWAAADAAQVFSAVVLRDSVEAPELADRIELTREMAFSNARVVAEVRARGEGALARMLSSLVVGDFVSLYLAFLRGMDPAPIEMIEDLKRALRQRREARGA
jgi:glucose/mannose-6-phosphate isomerase